jgi:hypothetical protein
MKLLGKVVFVTLMLSLTIALCCAQGLGDGFPPNPFGPPPQACDRFPNHPQCPGVPEPSTILTMAFIGCAIILHFLHLCRRAAQRNKR